MLAKHWVDALVEALYNLFKFLSLQEMPHLGRVGKGGDHMLSIAAFIDSRAAVTAGTSIIISSEQLSVKLARTATLIRTKSRFPKRSADATSMGKRERRMALATSRSKTRRLS